MRSNVSSERYNRVVERRHAVALARHFRDFEGLSIAQIAERLGRSPATIKAYFCDPSDDNKRPTHSPRVKCQLRRYARCVYGLRGHEVAPGLSRGTGACAGPGLKLGEQARRLLPSGTIKIR